MTDEQREVLNERLARAREVRLERLAAERDERERVSATLEAQAELRAAEMKRERRNAFAFRCADAIAEIAELRKGTSRAGRAVRCWAFNLIGT